MKEKRETVQMLVNVRICYDTPKARREALAAVREHLGVNYSSAGGGWFHVESGRVQLAPRATDKKP